MGLYELAASLEFIARLHDPTLALPYFAGEGTDGGIHRADVNYKNAQSITASTHSSAPKLRQHTSKTDGLCDATTGASKPSR